jgi:hypothetical protein
MSLLRRHSSVHRTRAVALLLVVVAIAQLASFASGAPHRAIEAGPVGLDRIKRPPLPAPIAARGGGVYVPRALGLIGTLPELEDFDPADGDTSGAVWLPFDHLPVATSPRSIATAGPNVRVNNTVGDPLGTINSETSVAAKGQFLVAGWNDSSSPFYPGVSGYGYSTDGGATFTDGGLLPPPSQNSRYQGDPCVVADDIGNFYYASLYTPDGDSASVAVNHGTFVGPTLVWDPPVQAIVPNLTDFCDKEWLAVDPENGNLYLSYSHYFPGGSDQLDFTRSTDHGVTWDPVQALTNSANGNMQGSRPIVGPDHEVYVVYYAFDNATSANVQRIRKSTDQGVSFGPEVTLPASVDGVISNFGSGPAGYNRPITNGLPSIAVDRSNGPHRGRVYVTWTESVDYYSDPIGTSGQIAEIESNGTPAVANPVPLGAIAYGKLTAPSDQDWYSFTGTAGQTVILYLVSGGSDGYLRLYTGSGTTADQLALSYIGYGGGLIVCTLPSSGTYWYRVTANTSALGAYYVYTGSHVTPNPLDAARDSRDVMLSWSDDGLSWTSRAVVNDDAPYFDNSFPEVAVDRIGFVYVDWYDHRNDPALGVGTDVHYARSDDGGATFVDGGPVNDGAPVNWNNVRSSGAPNMGDYSALVSDGLLVYANFADGRQGTPDSWLASIGDGETAAEISLVEASAQHGAVRLTWYASAANVVATVYRRSEDGGWNRLGAVSPDGSGRLIWRDDAVTDGARYAYRLGVATATGERYFGEVWVQVPGAATFALDGLRPNPASRDLRIAFTLPVEAPASLRLFDTSGREVRSLGVGPSGAGSHVVAMDRDALLAPGVYLVRLTQAGRTLTRRAIVTR